MKTSFVQSEALRFCKNTSIKGVGRLMKAETFILRCVWILGVVLLLSFCMNSVINTFAAYLDYPQVNSFNF